MQIFDSSMKSDLVIRIARVYALYAYIYSCLKKKKFSGNSQITDYHQTCQSFVTECHLLDPKDQTLLVLWPRYFERV